MQQQQCAICSKKASAGKPLGSNATWECSHVDCTHRNRITASPRDGLEFGPNFNLTSRTDDKDTQ